MNRTMAVCASAALGALLIGAGACGSKSADGVGLAEGAAHESAARSEPLQFRVEGMRRINGAL